MDTFISKSLGALCVLIVGALGFSFVSAELLAASKIHSTSGSGNSKVLRASKKGLLITASPSASPTATASASPSFSPSASPSSSPTTFPSSSPTLLPSSSPTSSPMACPNWDTGTSSWTVPMVLQDHSVCAGNSCLGVAPWHTGCIGSGPGGCSTFYSQAPQECPADFGPGNGITCVCVPYGSMKWDSYTAANKAKCCAGVPPPAVPPATPTCMSVAANTCRSCNWIAPICPAPTSHYFVRCQSNRAQSEIAHLPLQGTYTSGQCGSEYWYCLGHIMDRLDQHSGSLPVDCSDYQL